MNEWENEQNVADKFPFPEKSWNESSIVGSKPLKMLNLILTEELISIMVNVTSKYLDQELDKKRPLRRSSCFYKQVPINKNEIKLFLGIMPHMENSSTCGAGKTVNNATLLEFKFHL